MPANFDFLSIGEEFGADARSFARGVICDECGRYLFLTDGDADDSLTLLPFTPVLMTLAEFEPLAPKEYRPDTES